MTTPVVSIIIPIKDDAVRLGRCLEALSNQSFDEPYEILVVDNGSSDHPENVVERFPLARFLVETENGSYAARNAGVREARGQFFGFTDSDCLPSPHWIEVGVKTLRDKGEDVFVGGPIELFAVNPQRPTAAEVWDSVQGFPQRKYIEEQNFTATANLFVHRSALERTGPFAQTFISSGDREWGNRATASGIKGVYEEELIIRHPCRADLSEMRRKNVRMLQGDFQLRQQKGQSLITLSELLIAVAPPIPTLVRNLPRVTPSNKRNQLTYVWAVLYITYTRLFDRLRLLKALR